MTVVDAPVAPRLLPFVQAIVGGSADAIGFLGLGRLFIAHITGNLVIVAARLLAGDPTPVAHILSVPVFVAVLFLTSLLGHLLDHLEIATLRPLLLLQSVLLAGATAICVAAGPGASPDAASMILAAMLGVSAMAVHNALVRLSLPGSPATAVMTTNITTFTLDVAELLFGRDPDRGAKARDRARVTGTAIAGFLLGCALGALCEARFGPVAFVLPTGISLMTTLVVGGPDRAVKRS